MNSRLLSGSRRAAFTLVELLVVIAIIGVLVALLLPAVQAAREAARRLSCVNNLTQLIIAVQNYEAAFAQYPSGTLNPTGPITNGPVGYHHNWLSSILPYMEEQNTYQHIHFDVSVYDPANLPVRNIMISTHICPSNPHGQRELFPSDYAGLHHDVDAAIDADNHGVFFLNSALTYEQIGDGVTHTIFIGEKIVDEYGDLGWMSGTRATLRNTGFPINTGVQLARSRHYGRQPTAQLPPASPPLVGGFDSYHPGGANFAFGDGHVGFLTQTVEPAVLQQYGHRSDGKLLQHR